ncbi:hypothetical protein D043_0324B, partial [Vibrio parahaemolyticus EKP-021]
LVKLVSRLLKTVSPI